MEEGKDQMIDVKGKRVFLSGPMTGRYHYNVAAFAVAHARLKEAGADWVFDPAVAYLRETREESERHDHSEYMRRCLSELTRPRYGQRDGNEYELLVSLPGWDGSEGATIERAVAEACGIEACDLEEVFA